MLVNAHDDVLNNLTYTARRDSRLIAASLACVMLGFQGYDGISRFHCHYQQLYITCPTYLQGVHISGNRLTASIRATNVDHGVPLFMLAVHRPEAIMALWQAEDKYQQDELAAPIWPSARPDAAASGAAPAS